MEEKLRGCLLALVAMAAVLVNVACQTAAPLTVAPTRSNAARVPQVTATPQRISPEDAVRKVQASDVGGPMFAVFPTSPGWQSCDIQSGGRAGTVLAMTCRTELETSASGYVVNFTQAWDASQFHAGGEPGSGQLQHTWSFTISLVGAVGWQSQSGNFPPQYVK